MIRRNGPESVSARKLSEETGYSLRTLYKHFRNMDELFWLVRNAVIEDFVGYLSGFSEKEENGSLTDPVENLKMQFHRYMDYFLKEQNFYRFLYFYRLDSEFKTDPAYHETPDFPDKMDTAFRDLISSGNLKEKDIPAVSATLILTIQGLLTLLLSGTEELTDNEARMQLNMIIHFLLEKK